MKKIYFLFLVLAAEISSAQVYTMANGSINTCSGTFYDSGGNTGNYGNNESFVLSFCANFSGQCIRAVFSSFNIESQYDFLTVYDGPGTNSPVIGVFTDTIIPDTITATSGCLTFKFVSDNITSRSGWSAAISCLTCANAGCSQPCAGPPPTNDSCFHAINFGLLPTPQPCPGATGVDTTIAATNLCATQEANHVPIVNCIGGNLNPPLSDVWFTFDLDTSSGPLLNVNISSSVIHPALVLYVGNDCNDMIEVACDVSSTTNLVTMIPGLGPGHYFLQLSSDADTSQCDFSITLSNDLNCSGCIQQAGLIVSPLPVGGTYPPGTPVNFCFTVSSYNQASTNWLHAIVPTFGAGWDQLTFSPIPAVHCDTSGYWEWMTMPVVSLATGVVHGPGFYYESVNGNINMTLDNDPGNNYGDQNSNNVCDWTFCWTMSTRSDSSYCMDGSNLDVSIDTYGDGESGSWTSFACADDPVYYFFGAESCCMSLSAGIINSCTPGQSAAVAASLGTAPFTFEWKDSLGLVISSVTNTTGTDSLQNLFPGNYSVEVTDSNGCISTYNFTIPAPVDLTIDSVIPTSCAGCNNGSASFSVAPGPYTIDWTPPLGILNGTRIDSLPPGSYTICVTDTMGCSSCDTIVIADDPTLATTYLYEKSISVFPNPTNGITNVSFTMLKPAAVSIWIYDVFGREQSILFNEKYFEAGSNEISFDTKNLSNGFYFICLKTRTAESKRGFVVMKN